MSNNNNIMRTQYHELNEFEKAALARIKAIGADFWGLVDSLGNGRELALAKTKIEEAVMWAVKGMTP
jgi:hypothetical protein